MKFEIRHRVNDSILFEGEFASIKLTVIAAVKSNADLRGAYLSHADLRGAYLSFADFRGADFSGAYLNGAYLSFADLSFAYLRGADFSGANLLDANFDIPPATEEQAIKNLDVVAEIILGDPNRLYMNHWHGGESWKERSCAEEATCGTTHCLAGWLQVCSTDPKVRELTPSIAGFIQAPVAAKMFYESESRVVEWLKNREYAQ